MLPREIVSFVFPRVSMFPSTSSRETLRLSGKQNSLFPSEAHIKCILTTCKLVPSSIEFAWLITIIICTELSDAKSGLHWDSPDLEPHLPVNKQIFKYLLQTDSRKYNHMILASCSISHLNLNFFDVRP